MKKILILIASPRKNGNTNALVQEFCAGIVAMQKQQVPDLEYEVQNLYDQDLKPCLACRKCQADWTKPACVQGNDELFNKILEADLIVLATPVYSWYCTPPAKALLDRCVYAMNKYYGVPEKDAAGAGETAAAGTNERGPSLWAGKQLALITTCGYPPEKGADLLIEGMKRYCRHSQLQYAGELVERHMGYDRPFMDDDKAARAREFAEKCVISLK